MVRINCHSAFKHYEMFHNSCSGGSNYGSVFNTTYNINCGGHGGGFWGGFGAGLGNAFGNIFGGLFGGVMSNFGFGNFGMGGFGMGGFGMGGFGMGGLTMPWFNSMGNFGWGGGNAGSIGNTNNNSGSNSSNGVNDKDNALYNTYKKQVDNAIKDNDAKSAKKLYEKIKKSHEKPEDHVYEDMNKGAYHDLMTTLENKFPELKDVADAGKDKKTDNNSKADKKEPPKSKPEVTDPTAQGVDPAKQAAKENAQKIARAGSLDELSKLDYNQLTPEEKIKYINNAIELAKSDATTPAALRNALKGMPDEVRVKVKQSFYKDDFSNVDIKDLNAETLKNLIEVIDVSDAIPDFKNIKVGDTTKSGGNLWTIPMTSKNGGTHVNYIQVSINSEDGEIVFHGKQDNQKYVLQKDTNNKLHLMQYKYHEGYDEADVKAK